MLSQPTILTIPPKKFMGQRLTMSFGDNQTFRLWNTFMPRRGEIKNVLDANLYNIQLYGDGFFQNFDPAIQFEKWAAVEVGDFTIIPEGMEALTIPGGQYAVFNYKGTNEDADEVYRYIFQEWLPQSGYKLAVRPHFEILGEKYKHGSPDSEEEIWIPVL